MYTSQPSISSGGSKTASFSSGSGKSSGGSKTAPSSSGSSKKRNKMSKSDNSICGSLPPLHEDTLYQDDKENAVTKMSAANIQHFWSTLSIHASETVINVGGQATAALAVASSLLEDGEKMIRINETRRKQQRSYFSNSQSDDGSSSKKPKQEMRITPQTIHNAASKASIIILQKGAADSQELEIEVASAVAVAIIEKGTELRNDMSNERDNEVIEFPTTGVLTARTTSSLSGSQKSSSSQRSRVSKAERCKKQLKASNSNESMSTALLKMWDKYATSKNSEGKRCTKETQAQSNRSFAGQQYPESCIASSNSSERASFDYSEHTDNTTIATESYHGLGPPPSNLYSDTLKKREEELGRLLAAETEIIRQKGEALERGRAQFSTAADELQRKLEALQHQLDNIDAANSKENGSISNKSTDDTSSASRNVSSGNNSEEQESTTSTAEPSQATGNNSEEQESAASTAEPSQATGNNSEEQESAASTSEPSLRSVLKKPTKVFRIVEDEKIHNSVEPFKETAVDDTCLISSAHPSVEEAASETVLAKKTLKGRAKRVTWAAANTLCRIPGRTIKSAKKSVSRAFRRRGSVALTGLKRPLTRNRSSKKVEPPSTTDVPICSDESSHRSESELANTCEMSTVRTLSSSQLSRRTSSTSSYMDNSVTSSRNSMDFFDQEFYNGEDDSIDDETTDASLFTSYSMAETTDDDSILLMPTCI